MKREHAPSPAGMGSDVEPPALLRAVGLTVGWGRRAVLSDVSFSLRPGECIALAGPNGTGKSTLVRCMLGLAAPLSGRMERSPRWRAGYVAQERATDPLLRLRADEVVGMAVASPVWPSITGRAARRERVRSVLDVVGMADFARRGFQDLSGGQRQRVLLARALAADPTVLVLDEPTRGLDLRAERLLLDLVRTLRRERGIACVLVTHALHTIAREDLTVGLVHSGRVAFGPPSDVLAPARLEELYGVGVRLPDVGQAGAPGAREGAR